MQGDRSATLNCMDRDLFLEYLMISYVMLNSLRCNMIYSEVVI